MIFLADFSPIKPDFGLLFWTTLVFLLVWIPIGRGIQAYFASLERP